MSSSRDSHRFVDVMDARGVHIDENGGMDPPGVHKKMGFSRSYLCRNFVKSPNVVCTPGGSIPSIARYL